MGDMVQNKVACLAHEFCVCMWPIECKCGQCCSCVRVGFLCFCLFILIVFFCFQKSREAVFGGCSDVCVTGKTNIDDY